MNELLDFLRARIAEDPAPDAVTVKLVVEDSARRAPADTTGTYDKVLRQLAGRYAEHPDYRAEWAPE